MTLRPLPPLGPATHAFDVIAFGENSLDIVGVLSDDRRTRSKRTLATLDHRVGGQMATAAVGVARLGYRAGYVGSVGDDAAGGRIREVLQQAGVSAHLLPRTATPSRTAIVLVEPDGDRQVLEFRDPRLALAPAEVPLEACLGGRILLLDATNTAASVIAARAARERRIPTIVDLDLNTPGGETLLEAIDVIVVPDAFVREWSGRNDLAAGLAALGRRFPGTAAVVATRGPQGSAALARGIYVETPGFDVAVVDTTGAGDAFRAGLAAGWLRHADAPEFAAILRYANATAALNCRGAGAQAGLPSHDEVQALLNAQPPSTV